MIGIPDYEARMTQYDIEKEKLIELLQDKEVLKTLSDVLCGLWQDIEKKCEDDNGEYSFYSH